MIVSKLNVSIVLNGLRSVLYTACHLWLMVDRSSKVSANIPWLLVGSINLGCVHSCCIGCRGVLLYLLYQPYGSDPHTFSEGMTVPWHLHSFLTFSEAAMWIQAPHIRVGGRRVPAGTAPGWASPKVPLGGVSFTMGCHIEYTTLGASMDLMEPGRSHRFPFTKLASWFTFFNGPSLFSHFFHDG